MYVFSIKQENYISFLQVNFQQFFNLIYWWQAHTIPIGKLCTLLHTCTSNVNYIIHVSQLPNHAITKYGIKTTILQDINVVYLGLASDKFWVARKFAYITFIRKGFFSFGFCEDIEQLKLKRGARILQCNDKQSITVNIKDFKDDIGFVRL